MCEILINQLQAYYLPRIPDDCLRVEMYRVVFNKMMLCVSVIYL